MITKNIIQSAVNRNEIIAYFQKKYILTKMRDKFRVDRNTTIQIGTTTISERGVVNIPHTEVIFIGPEKEISKLIENFRLEFLRAGG